MQSMHQVMRRFFWGTAKLEFVTNFSSLNSFRSPDTGLGGSLSIAGAKYRDNQVSSTSPKECNDSVGGADVPRT